MKFSQIKIENHNKTGFILLNNPENLNIIESNTFQEIDFALETFKENENIKIVLIKANCGLSKTGKKVFSAGVNLKEYNKKFELFDKNPDEFESFLKKQRELPLKIENFPKPVIIAIDGLVIGGFFELALACDLILASESASFRLSEVNLGIIPGYGGIHRLLKIVGKNKTFEIIASGKEISPEEAKNSGIAAEIFHDEDFEEKVLKYCESLAEKPANSLYLTKDTIRQVLRHCDQSIENIEVKNFLKAMNSEDSRKNIRNFLKK